MMRDPQLDMKADHAARNRAWLVHALQALTRRIALRAGDAEAASTGAPSASSSASSSAPDASIEDGFVPALSQCAEAFGLSPFESELLLLLAGVEIDPGLRREVARVQAAMALGEPDGQPSFDFALRLLADPHWDALAPLAPLRKWRLIETRAANRFGALTHHALRIDERVLHRLTGVAAVEPRLFGLLRPAPSMPASVGLDDEGDGSDALGDALARHGAEVPVAMLVASAGSAQAITPQAQRRFAQRAVSRLGRGALWLQARDLPATAHELAETALLLEREARLLADASTHGPQTSRAAPCVPIIEIGHAGAHAHDGADAAPHAQRTVDLLVHMTQPAIVLGAIDPELLAQLPCHRVTHVDVPARPFALDAALATRSIHAPSQQVMDALQPALQQFDLPAESFERALDLALKAEPMASDAAPVDPSHTRIAQAFWQASRAQARGGLDALAQRIASDADFDSLVLPPAQVRTLRDIAAQLKHRHTVHVQWGMTQGTARDQGLCALFHGESGTGKTLAAEAIANEAALDLYRIDLASVVSKYIGETEKNLARLFDAAERSGAVLLFDEADALFGKRSDVKDSHDRYANIEVSYLLQRIEAYRGLAILTTNLKSAIDRAFLRRIRFVVQFPFPDAEARAALWRLAFPKQAPVADDVQPARLAALALSGGSIRNVALNAAFIAAAQGGCIDGAAVHAAARAEFAKLERPMTDMRREAAP